MRRAGPKLGLFTRWGTWMICGSLMLASCTSGADGDGTDGGPGPVKGPLSILLVNDDGWDAPGITAVFDALVADGHDVTLVAPLVNQSGKSMSTTDAPLAVTRPAGDVPKYAVDGTPVDSLNVGLLGILKGRAPDVVVSGVNTGANVAENTNYSGTVGAAAAAAQLGLPALAVSADVGGASGGGDYEDAAQTVVDLVDELAAQGFDGLGTAGFINVNVPFETADRTAPRGIKVVPLAGAAPRELAYEESKPGVWSPSSSYDPRVGAGDADAEQLADGWTTLTWLPVARTAPASGQDRLGDLVDSLTK